MLNNTGSISVTANASANAGGEATASADIDQGIYQDAHAFAASAAFANAAITNGAYGTIEVLANAKAAGSGAKRMRRWARGDQPERDCSGSAGRTGSAIITNSGNITIAATAAATGASGSASATAEVECGIYQNAVGMDRALVSLSNAAYGTIAVGANANAHGQTAAPAYANIDTAISQVAHSTGVGGYATAELTNNGAISVDANANAFGGRDGSAFGSATVGTGIYQDAQAYGSAAVNITNNGSLDILAAASASGDEDATATAGVSTGVYRTPRRQATAAMLPRLSPTTARSTSRRRPMRSAAGTCTPTLMPALPASTPLAVRKVRRA